LTGCQDVKGGEGGLMLMINEFDDDDDYDLMILRLGSGSGIVTDWRIGKGRANDTLWIEVRVDFACIAAKVIKSLASNCQAA